MSNSSPEVLKPTAGETHGPSAGMESPSGRKSKVSYYADRVRLRTSSSTKSKMKVHLFRPRRRRYRETNGDSSSDSDSDSPSRKDGVPTVHRYPWPESYKQRYANARPTLYEQQYPRDKPGTELDENGRVWTVYRDRATEQDNDLLEAWKEILDVLLVFAGLFSAVCTAFIIESHKLLSPDWDEIAGRAAYAVWATSSNGSELRQGPANPDQSMVSGNAEWANWLWFVSLSLSLVVALLAILAKQWIGQYRSRMRTPVPSQRHWVWRHRAFGNGLQKYQLDLIIMLLPPLLHIALFFFFAGLFCFLLPLSRKLALVIGIGGLCLFGGYIGLSLILPVLDGDCPMSTPLVEQLEYLLVAIYRRVIQWVRTKLHLHCHVQPDTVHDLTSYHEQRLFSSIPVSERNKSALMWMVERFRDYHDISVALDAISALPLLKPNRSTFKPAEVQVLRDATMSRSHHGSLPIEADLSEAERVCMLRTFVFLTDFDQEDIGPNDATANVASKYCQSIRTHDGPFIRQAFSLSEHDTLETLHALKRYWIDNTVTTPDAPFIPAAPISLALWSHRALRSLIFGSNACKLSLGELATILRCVVYCSADSHARDLAVTGHTSDSEETIAARASELTKYESEFAMSIDQLALNYLDRPAPPPAATGVSDVVVPNKGIWIVNSLTIWGDILESHQRSNEPHLPDVTLHAVYAALLGHLSSRTAPVDKSANLVKMVEALSYVITVNFESLTWTADSLIGPLDLLWRIVRHITQGEQTRNAATECWSQVSTTMAHLFHYIASHDLLARNGPLAHLMSLIVEDLGKQRQRRYPFAIDNVISPQILSYGPLALFRGPPGSRVRSIWGSACRITPFASQNYKETLLKVATTISLQLSTAARSPNNLTAAEGHAAELLQPEGLRNLLSDKNAAVLRLHVSHISPAWAAEMEKLFSVSEAGTAISVRPLAPTISRPAAIETGDQPPGKAPEGVSSEAGPSEETSPGLPGT